MTNPAGHIVYRLGSSCRTRCRAFECIACFDSEAGHDRCAGGVDCIACDSRLASCSRRIHSGDTREGSAAGRPPSSPEGTVAEQLQ